LKATKTRKNSSPENISKAGETILMNLWIAERKKRWRSFNELRRRPFSLNPVTLSRNLPILLELGLIDKRKATGRGGTRHQYSTTGVGRDWLFNPNRTLVTLDQHMIHLIGLSQGMKPDIESQHLGIDLLTKPKLAHELSMHAQLHMENIVLKLRARFAVDHQGRITKMKTSSSWRRVEASACRIQHDRIEEKESN